MPPRRDSATVALMDSGGAVDIEPGAMHMFAWPAELANDTSAGEFALIDIASDLPLDYMCWGTGVTYSPLASVAEREGLWSGECTESLIGGGYTLTRLSATDGTTRESYSAHGLGPEISCDSP